MSKIKELTLDYLTRNSVSLWGGNDRKFRYDVCLRDWRIASEINFNFNTDIAVSVNDVFVLPEYLRETSIANGFRVNEIIRNPFVNPEKITLISSYRSINDIDKVI